MTSDLTNKTLLPLILVAAGILVLAGAGVWLAVGQSPVTPSNAAADDSVLEWAVVELDACATDMMTAVRESCQYLTEAGLAEGAA